MRGIRPLSVTMSAALLAALAAAACVAPATANAPAPATATAGAAAGDAPPPPPSMKGEPPPPVVPRKKGENIFVGAKWWLDPYSNATLAVKRLKAANNAEE